MEDLSLFGIRSGINTPPSSMGISREYFERLLNYRYYWLKGLNIIFIICKNIFDAVEKGQDFYRIFYTLNVFFGGRSSYHFKT